MSRTDRGAAADCLRARLRCMCVAIVRWLLRTCCAGTGDSFSGGCARSRRIGLSGEPKQRAENAEAQKRGYYRPNADDFSALAQRRTCTVGRCEQHGVSRSLRDH